MPYIFLFSYEFSFEKVTRLCEIYKLVPLINNEVNKLYMKSIHIAMRSVERVFLCSKISVLYTISFILLNTSTDKYDRTRNQNLLEEN